MDKFDEDLPAERAEVVDRDQLRQSLKQFRNEVKDSLVCKT